MPRVLDFVKLFDPSGFLRAQAARGQSDTKAFLGLKMRCGAMLGLWTRGFLLIGCPLLTVATAGAFDESCFTPELQFSLENKFVARISPKTEMVLDSPWLTDWMQKNTKCLRHAFVQYGALLFRGFQIEDASAFEAVALAMVPNLEKEYLGTSPRSGIQNTTYVFTAADFQPHRTVPVHIEMSFRDFPPATQLFYAKRVDQWVGGETPLTDMQAVWEKLAEDPALREQFETGELEYLRNMDDCASTSQFDPLVQKCWQMMFKDEKDAKRNCETEGFNCTWDASNRLTLRNRQPFIRKHALSGRPIWYNHINVLHGQMMPGDYFRTATLWPGLARLWPTALWLYYRGLFGIYSFFVPDKDMGSTVLKGSGEAFSSKELQAMKAAIHEHTSNHAYRQHDVVMLDNHRIAHGREIYLGRRFQVKVSTPAFLTACILMSTAISKKQKVRFLLGVFDENDNRFFEMPEFIEMLAQEGPDVTKLDIRFAFASKFYTNVDLQVPLREHSFATMAMALRREPDLRGVQCAVVAMAPQLHELFEKVKLIRKRLKLKGRLVDFPPGKHDEGEAESQENPISTQSMAMNVPALKVMFEFYRVTSGKNVPVQKFEAQALGVRNLFEVIQTVRDEQGKDNTSEEDEGEEEEEFEDDDAASDYESAEADTEKPDASASDGPSSAEPKISKAGDASMEDDGGGVGDVPLDSHEDAQAPRFRRRSKGSLISLPSTAVLGKTPANVETPASYKDAVSAEKEAELSRLLYLINLQEAAVSIDPDPHKALLITMGTPERPSKAEGKAVATPDCKKQLDFEPAWVHPPDQAIEQADTQLPLGDGGTNEALAAGGDCTNGALSADGDGTNGVPAPIEVDSSPEKIKQEPSSPKSPKATLAEPVSLEAQNQLRQSLRASTRRVRKSRSRRSLAKSANKIKGKRTKTSSKDVPGDGSSVSSSRAIMGKRKIGSCDADPEPLPKAKAKAKAKAKTAKAAMPVPKAKAKTAKAEAEKPVPKAKATAKAKAKATAKKGGKKDAGETHRLLPDPGRSGYSICGKLLIGSHRVCWMSASWKARHRVAPPKANEGSPAVLLCAVVLLVFNTAIDVEQVYDALEVFAGVASLSKCLGMAGYRVAALELNFWDDFQTTGLGLLLLSILKAKDGEFVDVSGYIPGARQSWHLGAGAAIIIDDLEAPTHAGIPGWILDVPLWCQVTEEDPIVVKQQRDRQYPFPYGLRFVRAFPRLVAERAPHSQAQQVDQTFDPKVAFTDQRLYADLWADARMTEVIAYLRGAKNLALPEAARMRLEMLRVARPEPPPTPPDAESSAIPEPKQKKKSPKKSPKKNNPPENNTLPETAEQTRPGDEASKPAELSPDKKTSAPAEDSPNKKTGTPAEDSPSKKTGKPAKDSPSKKTATPAKGPKTSATKPTAKTTSSPPDSEAISKPDVNDCKLQKPLEAASKPKASENNLDFGNGKVLLHLMSKDLWKRTVEIQITKSKSNELTIVQRIKKVMKFCTHTSRIKTHTRRDKYEKDKVEYWVEEETKGSYKVSSTEAWNDKREINASDGIDLDEEGSTGDDESEDGEDDDDDDGGSESSDSASTPRKKRQRASSKKVKKSKKAKKEKKESKAKDNKKKKAIDNATEVMQQSLKTIHGYATKLSDFHDQLADLKASHAGTNKFFCEKSLEKLTQIVVDSECARFHMEDTKLRRTLLKKSKSDEKINEATVRSASDELVLWPMRLHRLQVACVGITYGMLQQRSSHLGFVIFVEPARLAQDKLNPANFFVIDTFHVCHKGIVADYATLSDYQLLGASKDFTKHMQVLYDEDVLGLDTMADYPVGRWFKGADTPLLAKFLQYRYCRALADCDEADVYGYNLKQSYAYEYWTKTRLSSFFHGIACAFGLEAAAMPKSSSKQALGRRLFTRILRAAAVRLPPSEGQALLSNASAPFAIMEDWFLGESDDPLAVPFALFLERDERDTDCLVVQPDESLPFVFKYTSMENKEVRFTSVASAFNNRELMESKALNMSWRVSYNQDEQENCISSPTLLSNRRRFKLSHIAPVDPPMETAASLDSASLAARRDVGATVANLFDTFCKENPEAEVDKGEPIKLQGALEYKTPVDTSLLDAWVSAAGDPDTEVRHWLKHGALLGANLPIRTCGVFPPKQDNDPRTYEVEVDSKDLWCTKLSKALHDFDGMRDAGVSKLTLTAFLRKMCPRAAPRHLRMFQSWLKELDQIEDLKEALEQSRGVLDGFMSYLALPVLPAELRQDLAADYDYASGNRTPEMLQHKMQLHLQGVRTGRWGVGAAMCPFDFRLNEGHPAVNEVVASMLKSEVSRQEEVVAQKENSFAPRAAAASCRQRRFLKAKVPDETWDLWNRAFDLLDSEGRDAVTFSSLQKSRLLRLEVGAFLCELIAPSGGPDEESTRPDAFTRREFLLKMLDIHNFRPPEALFVACLSSAPSDR
ncbi:Clavaminate synthase-like protein [Symbiodinium microadriaticum]|uniref:Clavaminate synthase-like protein n=1 Tax=Symbiodinium microadriaticum TaxID=2951 RepID=A0A1Q9EXR1_SYMMI|nr:Clavaminate synthase-like protein [Symbiodinium microadriaticum]